MPAPKKAYLIALLCLSIVAMLCLSAFAPAQTPDPTGATPPPAVTAIAPTPAATITPDVPADPNTPTNFSDLVQFVAWLSLNGLAVVVTLEKLPQFQSLDGNVKAVVVAVLLIVVFPIGGDLAAKFLSSLTPDTLATLQHYWALLVGGWYTWGASQYALPAFSRLTGKTP